MKKSAASVIVSGVAAWVAGFCYESGRKAGKKFDVTPDKLGASMGFSSAQVRKIVAGFLSKLPDDAAWAGKRDE